MNTSQVVIERKQCGIRCFSWGAAFVGAMIGIGLSFLLNLFSVGIGLNAFATDTHGISGFAIGGFIGFAIGVIASMFAAGWAAGHLGRPNHANCNSGALYGFVAWALTLVLGGLLVSPMSHFVSSYSNNLTNHALTVIKYRNDTASSTTATNANADAATPTPAEVEKAANDTGKAALALFALFFLGALAASLGGHCGMACQNRCCEN